MDSGFCKDSHSFSFVNHQILLLAQNVCYHTVGSTRVALGKSYAQCFGTRWQE